MTVWQSLSACQDYDPDLWFPERVDGEDNHGREAKVICATCPVRVPCLEDALARGEPHGIWGGAGADLRRWLGRAWAARQTDPARWEAARAEHFARLDGGVAAPANRNGGGATCGRRVTYARGCRCDACCLAAALDGQETKIEQRRTTAA